MNKPLRVGCSDVCQTKEEQTGSILDRLSRAK